MLETASIAGGAVAALFLTFVVAFFAYVKWHQNKKREFYETEHPQNGHYNTAADVVDGTQPSSSSARYCQQSQVYYGSQLASCSGVKNGDKNGETLQHPQQHQFQTVQHQVPMRPFGPHHDYQKITMSDVLAKR
jgi:hypothetical protein